MFKIQNSNTQSFGHLTKLLMASALLISSPLVLALEHSPEREQAITLAACQHNVADLNAMALEFSGYDRGYALYRLAAFSYGAGDTVKAGEQLKQAENSLAEVPNPESDALRAAVIAMSLGLDPQMAQQKGPLVYQLIHEAQQNDMARPRALLINGINLLYTPPAYGGGAEKSKAMLQLAIDSFERMSENANVTWGQIDAHIWLGQALVQLGDKEAAKIQFNIAAELQPECTWTQYWIDNL